MAARAASGDAQARFTEARTAFEDGNFSRALDLFEQCVALGMQGPAIHFNIGVAAYRNGDLARAESAFREVARTPTMAALAHYNLGLVDLQRGDERAARHWFEQAARDAPDERLAALIARRLGELPQPASPVWSLYGRAGAGYDDNVALRSASIDTAGSGEDDSFAELLFSGSYAFRQYWRVDGAASLLKYSSLDEFDQTAVSLGLTRGLLADAWYFEFGGYATQLSLGGDIFERSVAATAQATRDFSARNRLRAQLRVSSVDGVGDFSGLSGARSELGMQYDWGWRAWSFGANTRAEFNDSEDEVFGSRWLEFGADAQWAASPLWTFGGTVALRKTRHPADASTPDAWDDRRATYQLQLTRTLWKQGQLFVRYVHERNESPIEGHDYDRNWVAASIEIWR